MSSRERVHKLSVWLGVVAALCACRAAEPTPEPVALAPVQPRCSVADDAPEHDFDLGDGRRLQTWIYHQAWSELDPATVRLIVVMREESERFNFVLTSAPGWVERGLSIAELDELLAPDTMTSRRRQLADRIAPGSAN